ncbi:hypothetical protein WJX74_001734 [Apatococcus lobatus]|uniref:Uncharacterized protein n=1 Tax=Apatococcus lobatus TaxID=904363 RepID=A0AAW1QD29_9CHLO
MQQSHHLKLRSTPFRARRAELQSQSAPRRSCRARAQKGSQTAQAKQGQESGKQEGRSQDGKDSQVGSSSSSSNGSGSEQQQEDQSRYPSKDWTAGGWAGGEKGLQEFLAEEQEQKAAESKASSKKPAKSSSSQKDDPRRYPSKDRIGGLDGITGGFAGGERGLQQFVKEGDLTFAKEDARKQTSPVLIAGLLGLAATAGGILLTDSIDLGENFLSGKFPGGLQTGRLDSTTRLALEVALGLLGLTAFLAGGRALVRRLSSAIEARTASVSRALIVLVFAIAVVAAARYILETS